MRFRRGTEKIQIPEVLKTIIDLQTALDKSRKFFDAQLVYFKSEERRLKQDKKQFTSCHMCDYETKDKTALKKHKAIHRNKRKICQETRD